MTADPSRLPHVLLIIEDEDAVYRLLLRYFGTGRIVIRASSNEEAKIFFEGNIEKISFILSDVNVLDGSTVDFHREITPEVKRRGIRRIAITSGCDTADQEYFRSEGIPLLRKPLDQDAILIIRQIIMETMSSP